MSKFQCKESEQKMTIASEQSVAEMKAAEGEVAKVKALMK